LFAPSIAIAFVSDGMLAQPASKLGLDVEILAGLNSKAEKTNKQG